MNKLSEEELGPWMRYTEAMRKLGADRHKSPETDSVYETILEEAQRLIYGDRADSYGNTRVSFGRVAELWSAAMDVRFTPEQVILCMILLKVSRQISKESRDNIVDIAGYAGCFEKLERGL